MGDEGVDNTEVAAGLHESEDTRVAQLHVSQADHTDHGRDHILMGIDSTTASVPPGIESSSKNEFAWTPVMLELVLDHVAKNGLTKLDVLNSDPVFEGLPVGLEEIEKKLDQLFEINPGDLEYYFPEMPTAEGNASEEGSDEDSKSSEPSEASEEARDRKRRKGKKDALPKYGRKKHEEDEEYQEDDSSDEDYSEEDDSEMSEDGLTAEIKMKTGFGPLEFDRELDYHPQAYYPETFKRPHIYGRPSRKAYQAEIKATQEALERFKKLEEDRPRGTRSSSRLSARKRYTMDEDIDKMLDKELGDMEEEDKPREEDNLEKLDKILAMREVTQKMIDTEKAEDSLKRKDAHKIIEEQHPDVIKELSKAGDVSETGVTDSEEEKLVQDHITTHLDVLHAAEEEKIVQYLIKSEGVSYLHCEWMTEDEVLQRFGESGYARLSRFASTYSKTEEQNLSLWGGEPFNPAFLEVERVLAKKTFDETIVQNGRSVFQRITKFLVKWSELSYSECTWETAEDINNEVKIAEFYRHNSRRPPRPAVKPPEPSRLAQWYHQSPVFKNGNTLRDYQLDGLNWLIQCYHLRRNCILADEMGLGKTIQSVSFLNYLATEEYIRGPFLCVVPLSTLEHWKREIEEWTEMGVIVYYESVNGKANRALIREYEFFFENSRDVKFDVLITTYETLLADVEDLAELKWEHIVVDEGHRLKNRSSKLVRALLKIASPRRMLLTGTPIQNNTEELWTLLNFIEPEVFYSSEEFLSRFGNLTESKQVEELQKEIRPYVLRRMKESVEKSIPQKEETIIDIELTTLQKQYYRAIYDRNRNFLARGVQKANIPSLMNIEMELRKCCNHPWLIKGVEDKEVPADASPDDYFRLTVMASGKMVLLDKLLPKLKAEGHRVLIFSQMKRVLDILEEYVQHKNYGYERLDGASQGNIRQAAIDRFSRKGSDRFVFLLSTRAGGVGLNLTAADTVILYDSDWNPQADVRAFCVLILN
jgi:chromodomain-helicase-DNA-binding protein 7